MTAFRTGGILTGADSETELKLTRGSSRLNVADLGQHLRLAGGEEAEHLAVPAPCRRAMGRRANHSAFPAHAARTSGPE